MSPIDDEELVRRVIDTVWNRGELDVADELFAPDYVNRNGLIPDLVSGPEAIKISVTLYRLAFPELHIAVDALSSDGDTVALQWSAWRCVASAPFCGGSDLEQRLLTGTTRSRVAGGRIMESWTSWEQAIVPYGDSFVADSVGAATVDTTAETPDSNIATAASETSE